MLGRGLSSQSIWTAFDVMTTAAVRALHHVLRISWKRAENPTATFAVVGTSVVGGIDMIKGQESALTKPDYFQFFDESERAVRIEYDRRIEEPLGGIALALADVLLDNTDQRFTPGMGQTISTAILPNRPVKADIGFHVRGQDKSIPIFKGLTLTPKEDKVRRAVSIQCIDYIRFLDEYPLEETMYIDKTADEIIADILTTIGFSTDQYELDTGLNVINFAWFQKDHTAGERIRKICESEGGFFYQDEMGILRFENRRHARNAPHNAYVWTIEPDDILSWESSEMTKVINKCIVEANPRKVVSLVEVWRNFEATLIEHGETKEIWASFENPVTSITTPVTAVDYEANLAEDGSSTDETAGVSIVITKFAKSAKLEVANASGGAVYMTLLRLRGTPAPVESEIRESFEDTASRDRYGRGEFKIGNDFIDDQSFAYYLAKAVVKRYKDPKKRIRITVRGIPHLQLQDRVRVKDKDTNAYTEYRTMRIVGTLAPGEFRQVLDLREVTSEETDSWAIIGTSTVDSIDQVGI